MKIAIDHGYDNIKTEHCCFTTAISEKEVLPDSKSGILEYKERIYSINGARVPYNENCIKTDSDDFFLLTLVAIAKEMKIAQKTRDDIEILAGLPQKWYDAQLNDFRDYLTKEKGLIHFKFEGETYNIRIVGTKIFEQGYAAFMTSDNAEKYFDSEVCVVDIGGGTMDIIPVVNGNMQFDSCKIDKRAALWLVGSIQEKLETELYHTVSDETVIKYMIDGNVELPCKNKYEEIMKRELVKYCKQVYTILAQHRINTELIPIIFVGGGSVILKNFNTCNPNNKDEYITDIRANAKGFKKIESYL